MNSKPAPLPLVDDRPPIVQRAENILVWLREGNNGDVADIIVGLIGLVDQRADNLATLTAERDALQQAFELEESKRGVLGNMLRYISFVVSGREDSDVQLEVDRMKAQLAALTAEGVRLRPRASGPNAISVDGIRRFARRPVIGGLSRRGRARGR